MDPIKILIVDDDVISRMLLRTVLEKEDDLKVVGLSPDGERCIANIPLQNPDVVTLDIEMPGMDGIETLKRIRASWPDLPVIMYSSSAEAGAEITLQALDLGASDFVTKPAGRSIDVFPIDAMRRKLIPMIRGLAKGTEKTSSELAERQARARQSWNKHKSSAPIDIVAIGLSTGGPKALAKVIPQIPGDLAVPVVLVQHMPEGFTALLAERLDDLSELTVVEGKEDMRLEPGTLYIAPGGHHMSVVREGGAVRLATNQDAKVHFCRPAVDVLFRSVNEVYGANTLAVVMTGMGYDGRDGAELLQENGARVFIQDEASCVVWGMPGSIAAAGIPHEVFPLNDIAKEISTRVKRLGQTSSCQSKSA